MDTNDQSSKKSWLQALETLQQRRVDLFQFLNTLDPSVLNRQRRPSEWSILQVVAHLTEAEEKSLLYLKKKTSSGENFPATGWSGRLRCVLLRLAMASPLRFKAPSSVSQPEEEYLLDGLRVRFRENAAAWVEFVDQLPAHYSGQAIYRHPVLGRINLLQTFGFLTQHFDHHARQIHSRAKGSVG